MKNKTDHIITSFPSSRILTMDMGRIGMRKHHVKALVKIDVTEASRKIRAIRRKGEAKISFTSWLVKCIGHAVSEHGRVHALREGKKKLVIFDEVDISVMAEKIVEGEPVPIPLVIRSVSGKSIAGIHDEIEAAKSAVIKDESGYVIESGRERKSLKLFMLLPQFIRLAIWRILLSDPHRVKRMMGTVIVTSIGTSAKINGFAIPLSIHPACFAAGSIIPEPAVLDGKIVTREFLQMTILLDHDVIDGAPAARFVSRLCGLMESAHFL